MQLLLNCLFFSTRSYLVDTLNSARLHQMLRWCKKLSHFTQAAQSRHTKGPDEGQAFELTLDFTVEMRQPCIIILRKQFEVCAAVLTTDFSEFVVSFLHSFSFKNIVNAKKEHVTQHHNIEWKQELWKVGAEGAAPQESH